VSFEQTYVSLSALIFTILYRAIDSSELGDCLKSQRFNQRKSPAFVVHEGETPRFLNRLYVYKNVGIRKQSLDEWIGTRNNLGTLIQKKEITEHVTKRLIN